MSKLKRFWLSFATLTVIASVVSVSVACSRIRNPLRRPNKDNPNDKQDKKDTPNKSSNKEM